MNKFENLSDNDLKVLSKTREGTARALAQGVMQELNIDVIRHTETDLSEASFQRLYVKLKTVLAKTEEAIEALDERSRMNDILKKRNNEHTGACGPSGISLKAGEGSAVQS